MLGCAVSVSLSGALVAKEACLRSPYWRVSAEVEVAIGERVTINTEI